MSKTERVQLIAKSEGTYTHYGFILLDKEKPEYLLMTKLPNWETPDINIGDEGLVQYEEVKAGESYYSTELECDLKYKYCAIYFTKFIKISNSNNNNIIL